MSKNKNYEDFLNSYLNTDNNTYTNPAILKDTTAETSTISTFKEYNIAKPLVNKNKDFAEYEDVVLSDLPMGDFYYPGFKIKFRAVTVKEVIRFSAIDETAPTDWRIKLNEIINNCCIIEKPDVNTGKIIEGSYLDIKEGDRPWLIYMIREKSFPNGSKNVVSVTYDNKKYDIDLCRANIEKYNRKDSNLWKYFSSEYYSFVLEPSVFNESIYITPPTIGIKDSFEQYRKILKDRNVYDDDAYDLFFKLMPYLCSHVDYIGFDEMESLLKSYKELDVQQYSFLFDLYKTELNLGIRGLKKNMGVGKEIRANQIYPERLTSLFIIPNAFKLYMADKK